MELQNNLDRLYSVLIAGDVDLSIYDVNTKVPEYVAYKYSDRKNIRENAIHLYKELIKNLYEKEMSEFFQYMLTTKLLDIENMSDEEYFEDVTKGMKYEVNTGDALTTMNPNWKYTSLHEPTIDTTFPLVDNKFTCKVSELKPFIENDKLIYELKDAWNKIINNSNKILKKYYIETYGNIDTYIKFFSEKMNYNAFVSKETGWVEQCDENQIEWVLNFRERFINNLSENTTLKVLNFRK